MRDDLMPETESRDPSYQVLWAVARRLGVSVFIMRSSARTQLASYARHVAMYLLRELLKLSWADIARTCGRSNHTTALAAHRRIAKMVCFDLPTTASLAELRDELRDLAPCSSARAPPAAQRHHHPRPRSARIAAKEEISS